MVADGSHESYEGLDMKSLDQLLDACATFHHHLCPRQVLGIRMGMLAGRVFGLDLPQEDKRLLAICETDGCMVDGVAVATGCWVGRRTVRIVDYGKVAATFVDTCTGRAVRIFPRHESRQLAQSHAPEAPNQWQAQLLGYQRMPDDLLLSVQEVRLNTPVVELVSQPGKRAVCQRCGEEIINEREVVVEGLTLCRRCAGDGYYRLLKDDTLTCQSR